MTIRKMLLGTAAAMLIATQVMCVSIANASEAMSGLEFLKIDSSRDDKKRSSSYEVVCRPVCSSRIPQHPRLGTSSKYDVGADTEEWVPR